MFLSVDNNKIFSLIFSKTFLKKGICIAVALKIRRDATTKDLDSIIADLAEFPNSEVVVIFANEDYLQRLLGKSAEVSVLILLTLKTLQQER